MGIHAQGTADVLNHHNMARHQVLGDLDGSAGGGGTIFAVC